MEMEMQTAAADMDFNALSRRELQALCKLNGVRANMTNLAMVEALQSLAAVTRPPSSVSPFRFALLFLRCGCFVAGLVRVGMSLGVGMAV